MVLDSHASAYCRDVEAYLCRKNDGHLIRIVGPSFELVSRWAGDGVPLKIAFRGIDRYFERYYRKGPRRRPVRVDFCEADVRDAFDEWRRAVGLTAGEIGPDPVHDASASARASHRGPSLPAHLERAVRRLTSARVTGMLGEEADALIDRVSRELDGARASARGLRGGARHALVARLAAIDEELLRLAHDGLDKADQHLLRREAEEELAGFRASMAVSIYERARKAAIDRLVRERCGLPILIVP